MAITTKKRKKSYYYGLIAEKIAVILLILKGYTILSLRERNSAGEIDIIAKRLNVVVFIEVKARKKAEHLHEVLLPRQQQRIARAASLFLAKKPTLLHCDQRFDLMLISSKTLPKHIKNAWNIRH